MVVGFRASGLGFRDLACRVFGFRGKPLPLIMNIPLMYNVLYWEGAFVFGRVQHGRCKGLLSAGVDEALAALIYTRFSSAAGADD